MGEARLRIATIHNGCASQVMTIFEKFRRAPRFALVNIKSGLCRIIAQMHFCHSVCVLLASPGS